MTNLVIVESPAKCQKIQGFLGAGWKVIASMGHIRALEQSLDAIGLNNNFEPKYEFIKEKAKAIKQLKEAAATASEVYLAADDDREGENIAYSVCILLKLNPKTAKRAVFHEITSKAVKAAVNNPRVLDMNRVNAQQARAMLDMMIGFTMSPLLWRYVGPSLSAGRCQTPALRLVVEREEQITSFKSQSSWRLSLNWKSKGLKKSCKFLARLEDELDDEESALNYMENVHQTPGGSITSKDIVDWKENAPQPLITSTLQQQASALFGINPKQTMRIAQKLYEAGHITYMRTDKAVISEEAQEEAKKWVTETYGQEFVGTGQKKTEEKKKAKSGGKEGEGPQAQEAHEAIRPTHMDAREITGDWTGQDKKVYSLIWQRAVQSVMAAAKGETCKVKTQIDDDEDFVWYSQWKRTTFEGWKIIGKVAKIDDSVKDDTGSEDDEEGADEWAAAVGLKVGDKLEWTDMKAEPHETKAQGRYTEATLVRELEKHGIGRPSTFASLLAVIQEKNYVETKDIPAREITVKEYTLKPNVWPATEKESKKKQGAEKNKLAPTDLGRSVLRFMLDHFDDLFNYGFTSQMEKRLDKIAEGAEVWKNALKDMWESYKDRYETLLEKQQLKSKGGESERIKEFSNGLKAIISKKGPLLLVEGATKEDTKFIGWPKGVDFQDMTEEKALEFKASEEKRRGGEVIGEYEDKEIIKKSGKFGDYLQCDSLSIPYQAGEALEKTIERFKAKQEGGSGSKNVLKKFKEYEVRTGQYGPYIIKTSLKIAKFVSVPKGTDIEGMLEKEVERLYKDGLENKKKYANTNKEKSDSEDNKKSNKKGHKNK
jgi:DNA topoisomerase-1